MRHPSPRRLLLPLPMSGSTDRIPPILADRYRVLEELGRGGMAAVYRSRDLKHERDVAVKVLSPEAASSVSAHRFHREIRIAAALNHPHILPIYDSGESDGFLYYVMPVMPDETLRQRLDRLGTLPVGEVVELAGHVAAALDHAHARNIVHRDVKPANVFLSGGEALLGDFGVAVVWDAALRDERLTSGDVAVGSPRYMSPEQITDPGGVDWRADVFAFAIVWYECLTGRHPFARRSGEHPLVWMTRDPEPPGDPCPPALARFLLRCLSVDPGERIPRGASLGEAWAAVAAECIPSLGRREGGRPTVGTLLVAGVVLAAFAAVTIHMLSPAPAPPGVLVVGHGPVVTWESREEEGRFVPGRQEISFRSDRDGEFNVWVAGVGGEGARQLTREDAPVVGHAWSQDGDRLAYVVSSGDRYLLVLADSGGRILADGVGLPSSDRFPRLVGWHGDRVHLVADDQLWWIEPAARRLRPTPTAAGIPSIRDAALHPQGDRMVLAGLREDAGTDLWIAGLEGDDLVRLTDDAHQESSPCWLGPGTVAFLSDRAGRTDVWSLRLPDGEPRSVTAASLGASHVACAADGTALVIDRQDETADLWIAGPDGTGVSRLTADGLIDLLPSVSRGGRVAFQRERVGLDAEDPFFDTDVLVGSVVDGALAEVRTVVEGAFHPVLAPDGTWLAFHRISPQGGAHFQLGVAAVDGGTWTLTERLPLAAYRAHPPVGWESRQVAWGPGDAALYYLEEGTDTTPGRIRYLMRARMTPAGPETDTIVAFDRRSEVRDLSVSPGGERVAYVVQPRVGEGPELRVSEVDGGRTTTLHRETVAGELHAVGWLGPDGPLVALRTANASTASAGAEPLLVELDGAVATRPHIPGAIPAPARLDPADRSLLVPVLSEEALELRRIPLDGTAATGTSPLVGVPFSGAEPLPDGRIIFARHDVSPDIWRIVLSGPG